VAKSKSTKNAKKKENAVIRYLRETRTELRKVHWPSREEAWGLTKVVLAVTISMALLLGVLDWLFALELRGIIERDAIAIGVLVVVAIASVVGAVILSRQAA
jgi:preprotein translocase subunit SecE